MGRLDFNVNFLLVLFSSRRLEVSRFELILQVGTFCVAVGALVAGICTTNINRKQAKHIQYFLL